VIIKERKMLLRV